MTSIFLCYPKEHAACAEELRTGLEAQGYTPWREPTNADPKSASYPHMIETAVLGSAAVVLVWSQHAAQTTWVERQLLFAQSLKKPIFPVTLDHTSLPGTLVAVSSLAIQTTCTDAVTTLIALPAFPPAHATDALITLAELAAHEFIRKRKTALRQASTLLARGEQHEEVLALLAYMAKNDSIMGVREEAQKVLDTEAKKTAPPPPAFPPGDAQHIFGVRCKNGHVSYFDKRVVCVAYKPVKRLADAVEKQLDELYLKCDTCGEKIVAQVDCEGYR